jgi:serine O-acetyltransferase
VGELTRACRASYRAFLEDVDRYRLRPRPRWVVILLCQGLWAIAVYRFFYPFVRARSSAVRRVAHLLSVLAIKFIQIVSGISLPPECEVGPGFYIGHFGTTLINPRVRIGRCCNIANGVIIGSGGRGEIHGKDREGVPEVGDRVFIGPGAVVFGPIRIGNDASIGANSVVHRSVPDRAVVSGVPARVVGSHGSFLYVSYRGMEDDPDRLQSLRERDAARRQAR